MCCCGFQVEHVVNSSDSQSEALRKEIRALKETICDVEAERNRARDATRAAEEQGRQLQSAAQFTERSLIVADIVIRKERCATAFRAWAGYLADERSLRDSTVAREKAVADAVDAAVRAVDADKQQELLMCSREWEQRLESQAAALHARHLQQAREWSDMASEDVLATSCLWCNRTCDRLAANERLWAYVLAISGVSTPLVLWRGSVFGFCVCRARLESQMTRLSSQFSVEKHNLIEAYEARLATAESGRQALVTSFMEEAAAERQNLLQEHAVTLEMAREDYQLLMFALLMPSSRCGPHSVQYPASPPRKTGSVKRNWPR
jgi:hypothetical protein